jgi:hypothetical protein
MGVISASYWIYFFGGSITIYGMLYYLNRYGYSSPEENSKYDLVYFKIIEKTRPSNFVIFGGIIFFIFAIINVYIVSKISNKRKESSESIDVDIFISRSVDFKKVNSEITAS